jgi:hypothetical protein
LTFNTVATLDFSILTIGFDFSWNPPQSTVVDWGRREASSVLHINTSSDLRGHGCGAASILVLMDIHHKIRWWIGVDANASSLLHCNDVKQRNLAQKYLVSVLVLMDIHHKIRWWIGIDAKRHLCCIATALLAILLIYRIYALILAEVKMRFSMRLISSFFAFFCQFPLFFAAGFILI